MDDPTSDGPVSVTVSTEAGNIKILTTGTNVETVSSDSSTMADASSSTNASGSHHLTKSVIGSLPPTLRSFTLAGKVCVVTG